LADDVNSDHLEEIESKYRYHSSKQIINTGPFPLHGWLLFFFSHQQLGWSPGSEPMEDRKYLGVAGWAGSLWLLAPAIAT
jgi:hypothetical protein